MAEKSFQPKMLVLDIDGTLLRPDRTLSPRVREAVRHVSSRMPTVLATARPPRSVRAIAAELGLEAPQVNYNGALLWDPVAQRELEHIPLDSATCAALMTQTRSLLGHSIIGIEYLDRWYTDRIDERFTTETGKLFPPDFIEPMERLLQIGATKLMFHAAPDEIDQLRLALEPQFAHNVSFIRTDPDLLQMMNRSTSKWTGILNLAARYGIGADGIVAIGDNENDIEMIGGAGLGIAMGNATPGARSVAKWVAPSNAEDGVADAIDRHILRITRS
jgi:Cof subfamily protein (haloacid dehalogenase superfamily)